MHCQYVPHGHFATCVVGQGFVFPYINQGQLQPPKTNGRNLKIPPLEKEKHLQKPPIFKVPAVSFRAYAQPSPLRFRFSRRKTTYGNLRGHPPRQPQRPPQKKT